MTRLIDSEEELEAALSDDSVVVEPGENLGDSPVAVPIKGYRNLSPREIELINASKTIADEIGSFTARLSVQNEVVIEQRWLALARTYLQLGFMALNRSIAKPESF